MGRARTLGGLLAIFLLVGAVGGCQSKQPEVSQPQYTTTPVSRGEVIRTVYAPGELVLADTVELRSPLDSKLLDLLVKPGEKVKKGDVLARLDMSITSLQKAIIQAKISLARAEENLEKAQNPYSESDIAQAEAAVVNAKVALNTAQDNLEKAEKPYTAEDIARAEAELEAAQVNMDNARQDLTDTQKDWGTKIEEAEDRLTEAKDAYKEVFRNYFGMNLTEEQLWQEPDTVFSQANIDPLVLYDMRRHYSFSEAEEVLQALAAESGGTWDPTLVFLWQYLFPAPPTGQDTIEKAQEAWEALVEVRDLPEVTRLRAAKAIAASEGKVAQAKDSLAQAQEHLVEMKAGPDPLDVKQKQKQLAVAQANLAKVEETLAEMQGSADPLEVKLRQLEVDSAQAALDEALNASPEITAPWDGVVMDIKFNEGDKVIKDSPIIVLADLSRMELLVTVGQDSIISQKPGMTADISLDALPGTTLKGKVNYIAPRKSASSRTPTYEIYLSLNDVTEGLLPGMSGGATILIAEKHDVLRVLRRLVKLAPDGSGRVEVLEQGQPVSRKVVIGVKGDSYYEILSGLNEGDLVVQRGSF